MNGVPISDPLRAQIERVLGREVTAAEMGATASYFHFSSDDIEEFRRMLNPHGSIACLGYVRYRLADGYLPLAMGFMQHVLKGDLTVAQWMELEKGSIFWRDQPSS